MEAFFVDVGQGTCNIVATGDRSAIVIDCGRRDQDAVQFLHYLNIDHISFLIISHSDTDHSTGAIALLRTFRGRIGKVVILQDAKTHIRDFFQVICDEYSQGHLSVNQIVRLERESHPKLLNPDERDKFDLRILAPYAIINMIAANDPQETNATSGVLVLKVGTSTIVFPGDSTIDQWEAIFRERGASLPCNVLAVPHHGGKMHEAKSKLDWLYTQAVQTKFAIISVGTNNSYYHPREDVVKAITSSGATLICTQVTPQCCAVADLNRWKGLSPLFPGRSMGNVEVDKNGARCNVPCGGTILAEITSARVNVKRLGQHQVVVDQFANSGSGNVVPLCRR